MHTRKYCPDCDAGLTFVGDDVEGTRTGLWCRNCWKVFNSNEVVVREYRIDESGKEWVLTDGEWICNRRNGETAQKKKND